jgi:DNA-binding SARP family transcriptional activator/tetratricopeptide (TPR) repeat protein
MDGGTIIRRHRLALGWTQEDLAARAELSVRALRDIEQSRVSRPRSGSLQALANALHLSGQDRWELLDAASRPAGAGAPLYLGVLGPLMIRYDDEPVEITQSMQRNLLCLLALQAGTVVPRDQIVDLLWGSDPPRSCLSLVHDYVGRLRKKLEPARRRWSNSSLIRSVSGGYLLDVEADELDLRQLEELATAGFEAYEAGAPEAALGLLTRAMGLVRGRVLADGSERLRQHWSATAAAHQVLVTTLSAADIAIAAGQPGLALGWLRPLIDQVPLHEGVHARLILALAGNGDQAAALDHFAAIRGRLADELGVEPTTELQEAQLRVLRQDLPTGRLAPSHPPKPAIAEAPAAPPDARAPGTGRGRPVVPANLPPDVAGFTGRSGPLDRLDHLLAPKDGDGRTAVRITIVTGVAGVGKSALAVRWAQQVRERFPDGQLYLNLRGYSAEPPLSPLDGLSHFLHALGLQADRIPTNLETACALYRSLMADRRMIVLLDNARSVDQVRPLLPGGPDSVVLVTSRSALTGLIARDGADCLTLTAFTPDETHALLAGLVGPTRVADGSDAVAELGRLCDHLPLALRIAAAHLIQNPNRSIDSLVRDMRDGRRLDVLDVVDDRQTGVREIFALSYQALPDEARQLFRSLPLVPGQEVDPEQAAAIAGTTRSRAQQLLDRLAGEHLISPREHDRFTVHELLRLYAQELGKEHDPPASRAGAVGRLYQYYLQTLDAAARLLYPHKVRMPQPEAALGGTWRAEVSFERDTDAMAWLAAERANLVTLIQDAATGGLAPVACVLADWMRGYFWLSMHRSDWITVARIALASAPAGPDRTAVAAAHLSLGDLFRRQSDNDQAVRHYARAAAAARRSDWSDGYAAALGSLGRLYRQLGHLENAARLLNRALSVDGAEQRPGSYATNLGSLGLVYRNMGRIDEGIECYRRALTMHEAANSRTGQAAVLANLGEAHHAAGDLSLALEHLTRALILQRELGDVGNEPTTLRLLAAVDRDIGRHGDALEMGTTALNLARSTGHRGCEAGTLNVIASVHQALGSHRQALELHQRAMRLSHSTGERYAESVALLAMAELHRQVGAAEQASRLAHRALEESRRHGYRLLESRASSYRGTGSETATKEPA